MAILTLRLDSAGLTNRDADLRCVLPDSLADRSRGSIRNGGYDCDADGLMTVFLEVDDREAARELIRHTLATERFLDNDLSKVARLGWGWAG